MKAKIISLALAGAMMLALPACGNSSSSEAESKAAEAQPSAGTILGQEADRGTKYTLYIGLNDKDTFEQKMSTEEAVEKANKICADHAGGFTQMNATGGWTNEDGTMGRENTLVYMIYDISEKDLRAILDELIKEFNQSSVLVEAAETSHIYYSGE